MSHPVFTISHAEGDSWSNLMTWNCVIEFHGDKVIGHGETPVQALEVAVSRFLSFIGNGEEQDDPAL